MLRKQSPLRRGEHAYWHDWVQDEDLGRFRRDTRAGQEGTRAVGELAVKAMGLSVSRENHYKS